MSRLSLIVRRNSQPRFTTLLRTLHARLLHPFTCGLAVEEFGKQSKIKSTPSSLASSNVGSRGFGSEASDDWGRQNRVDAGARVVFQGDG